MAVPLRIAYDTSMIGSGYEARCRVYVGPLKKMLEIKPFTPETISFPDDIFDDSSGIGIRFFIGFVSGHNGEIEEISAVASVYQPQEINLNQSGRWHMVGTIIGMPLRILGASAIRHDCEMKCEPPANESIGPGGCVVCKQKRGVFELCC